MCASPSTSCSLCGYAHVVVRLRPLWLALNDSTFRHGTSELDLCADCRNRVLDTLQPAERPR